MTKNIRKAAPESAEYFRITGDCIEYAKIGVCGRLYTWKNEHEGWCERRFYDAESAIKHLGFHAFEAPKWIWFALGGLFGAVIVSLIFGF